MSAINNYDRKYSMANWQLIQDIILRVHNFILNWLNIILKVEMR